jgi:serine protease Do
MKLPVPQFALALCFSFTFVSASFGGPIEVLKERERKVKKIVAEAMPAVVAVVGVNKPATGSGVVISEDGLIMTAGHVTDAAGQELTIIFPDGRSVKGKSLGANRSRDAGLAQITEEGKWPYVEIGDSEKVELGDWVVSMGHPGGYDLNRTPPVRLGRIISKGQMGMLGSDCTLVGGDSGGPMFDLDGKVIGIHSSIGGSLAENRHVPAAVFKSDWERMVAGDVWGNLGMMTAGVNPNRPMLGVQMSQEDEGVVVRGVMPNSPAEKAGIMAGDLILKVDGEKPADMADVVNHVSSQKAGDTVEMLVKREGGKDGGEKTFSVKLVRWADLAGGGGRPQRDDGGRPPEPVPASGRPQFGVMLDTEAEADGATIYEVMQGSAADSAGLKPGDIVLKIDGEAVGDAAGMVDLIGGYKPGEDVEVFYLRGDDRKKLKLKLGGS